jgi:uncharacterized membrane protein
MPSIADAAAPSPGARRRFDAKRILWAVLGAAMVWVLLSNEVALLLDYPLYHAYRLQMALDRGLLIPHAMFGAFALIAGTLQFSSRLRQRRADLHRLMGRSYVVAVYGAAFTAFAISWNRPLMPGTLTQGLTWIVVTTVAWVLARGGHVAVHRQWVARSYAVTFTFVSLRVLSIWPAFWNLSDAASVVVIIVTTLASVLVADLITNWRELTSRRA